MFVQPPLLISLHKLHQILCRKQRWITTKSVARLFSVGNGQFSVGNGHHTSVGIYNTLISVMTITNIALEMIFLLWFESSHI